MSGLEKKLFILLFLSIHGNEEEMKSSYSQYKKLKPSDNRMIKILQKVLSNKNETYTDEQLQFCIWAINSFTAKF